MLHEFWPLFKKGVHHKAAHTGATLPSVQHKAFVPGKKHKGRFEKLQATFLLTLMLNDDM